MFCADSHKIGNEESSTISHSSNTIVDDGTMENDILRNVTLTAINHPSQSRSILMSLVDDLSFWDIDESCRSVSRCNRNGDCNRNLLTSKNRIAIPCMAEATMPDERESRVYRSDAKGSFESDDVHHTSPASCITSWKTAVDPSTGKTYYYDSVTRKTQWDKVGFHVLSLLEIPDIMLWSHFVPLFCCCCAPPNFSISLPNSRHWNG